MRRILALLALFGFLTACSGGIAIAPKPADLSSVRHSVIGYYSCPLYGAIEYVSDRKNGVIDVYAGKFAGQAPCAQITSKIYQPQGLFVQRTTHDLYVANAGDHDILVFHRGWITAYNKYRDPNHNTPVDVTVANDGTVIASNQTNGNNHYLSGSISTWIGGPNGGIFVGSFPMTNVLGGRAVTAQANGTVYYDDADATTRAGAIWSMTCPRGACGVQTQVATLAYPGGLGSDGSENLMAVDQRAHTLDKFDLPNPAPSTIPLAGSLPTFFAMERNDKVFFVVDLGGLAYEYSYPGGVPIGTVTSTDPGSYLVGIAIDPAHAL